MSCNAGEEFLSVCYFVKIAVKKYALPLKAIKAHPFLLHGRVAVADRDSSGPHNLSMVEGCQNLLIFRSLFMRNFDLTPLYRSAIGFDRLFSLLESNQNQANGGYPPYNVELVDENHYRITIAVAGFAQSELDITSHDNVLIIRGAHPEEQPERKYLYQGIAERNFERKFQLADHIVVRDARLELGLLSIDLERIVPEEAKPRRIEILN
jgi:molecular chaperone IbpA